MDNSVARFFHIVPVEGYPTQAQMEALKPGDSLRFLVREGDLRQARCHPLEVELTPALQPGGYRVDELLQPGVWMMWGALKIGGVETTAWCLFESDPERCKREAERDRCGHRRGWVQITPD